jgi:hypothetical protein
MFKVCGRLKGLIPYKSLILPQSRESAEVRAQPYSSGAHRPCSAKAITRGLNRRYFLNNNLNSSSPFFINIIINITEFESFL